MQIIAQSRAPTRVSYIHLAYISAQLGNRISKGDLFPTQAFLGIALTTAIACGAIGAKLASKGARVRAMKIGAVLGFVAALGIMWMIEAEWRVRRSNEEVVSHVLRTHQFWALREAPIAARVEAAASTNGAAASLAATYYSMKGMGVDGKEPQLRVKAYRYCEEAAAKGYQSSWIRTNDMAAEWNRETFKAALATGKLSPAEEAWAKRKMVEFAQQGRDEEPVDPK
jgi:hypothetical protein